MESDNATARNPTESMQFCWPWRAYQNRVLDAMQSHLYDDRLHVVAAPGSGKTTLGLELFRRIGKAAVVLSPTRIIRDQWIQRLTDFMPERTPVPPIWTSRDLDHGGFFTSLTYQALHTRYRLAETEEDEEAATDEEEALKKSPTAEELKQVARHLKELGVGVLILDEAHHLRQDWWKALMALLEQLDDVKLIALTATPPYDVVGSQWRRYEELCGPIDEEISVPELVKTGTLCPHQDYIWTVSPWKQDVTSVRDYDARANQVANELLADSEFLAAICQHPWIQHKNPNPTEVLEEPEVAVAMLVYLRARERPLPEGLLGLLDCNADELPDMSRRWWQVLVREYLYGKWWDDDKIDEAHRKHLAKRLRSDGLLWRRELRLQDSRPVKAQLALTGAKIDACIEVYQLERQVRGDRLRQVILTDFIRDDVEDQLGAWPVFVAMIEAVDGDQAGRMALLTGRLAVVHRDRWDELRQQAPAGASCAPLESHPPFVTVSVTAGRGGLVTAFTRLLIEGRIHVLVGTRALLGEGWDAPAVNSLVLATYVGSYMLTNQMRGRAIRTDRAQPDKASSIWHLCAIDPGSESGLADVAELERRFETFVGLAASAPRIEGGIHRLDLPTIRRPASLPQCNQIAAERLCEIHRLRDRWNEAIVAGGHQRVLPGIEISAPPTMRAIHFRATLKYLLACAVSALCHQTTDS